MLPSLICAAAVAVVSDFAGVATGVGVVATGLVVGVVSDFVGVGVGVGVAVAVAVAVADAGALAAGLLGVAATVAAGFAGAAVSLQSPPLKSALQAA